MKTVTSSLIVFLALVSVRSSADVVTIVDNTPGTATNDGTVNTGEYVGFGSGINSGYGNFFGSLSKLYVNSSTSGSLNFGFVKGGDDIGNNAIVIYIDSIAGGFTTTQSFTDTADGGRRAISGYNGSDRATFEFASGFAADYAITLDSTFAGIFQLKSNGSHTYIDSANRTNMGSDFEMSLTLADIGLGVGDSFKYVGTYLNKDSVDRSNEFHGVGSYGLGNPGHGLVSLASGDFNVFTSVPEVSPALGIPMAVVIAAGTGGVWRRWRTKPSAQPPIG